MSGLGRRTHYRKHLTDSVLYDYPEPGSNECIAKIVATRGSNQFDIQLANNHNSADDVVTQRHHLTNNSSNNNVIFELAILPTKFRKLIWLKRNDYVIVQYATSTDNDDDDDDDNDNQIHYDTNSDDNNTNGGINDHDEAILVSTDDNLGCRELVASDADVPTAIGSSNNTGSGKGGIRYMITHILYKNQIQHLIAKGLWPIHDPDFVNNSTADTASTTIANELNNTTNVTIDKDGIVFTTNNYNPVKSKSNEDTQENGANNNHEEEDDENDNDENEDDYDDYTTDDDDDDDLFVNTNRMSKIDLQDSDDE